MKVKNMIYYKIDIELLSPLSVGSGENAQTDKDVIVDSLGNPFIPATAIAGVLRSYIKKKNQKTADNIPLDNAIFGYISTERLTEDEKNCLEKPSCIRVYDACCTDGTTCCITTRDSVKLEKKIAVEGAKFDMEVVETGATFTGYLELLSDEAWCVNAVEEALAAVHIGKISVGSKTSRGYGRLGLVVKKRVVSDVKEWLEFRMFDDEAWAEADAVDLDNKAEKFELTAQLELVGGISVRKYTTTVSDNGESMPDYQSLSLESNADAVVIPGTSWAGAFRSRFAEIVDTATVKSVFGDVDPKTKFTQKSKIMFGESVFSGGTYKISTRNAIDRFSGATKDGALYTEKTYYYGSTELNISFADKPDKNVLWALGVCLADLHNGFLAVGGLTSVGRGLFKIASLDLNGKKLNLDNIEEGNIDEWVKEVYGA